MGSAIGGIGAMEKRPAPIFAYGASKAMAHYLVRKVHFENERITVFAIDPGQVHEIDLTSLGGRNQMLTYRTDSFNQTWATRELPSSAWRKRPFLRRIVPNIL